MITALALLGASTAVAADPTGSVYGGQGGVVQDELQPVPQSQPVPTQGGGLPFTGLDLTLLLGGGVVLLAVGGSLWRLTREKA
jgi:hypothetical protein